MHTLGMLSQIKENTIWLEDPDDIVQLDITRAASSSGIFTEGCIVIVEGIFDGSTLKVATLLMPTAEPRSKTL